MRVKVLAFATASDLLGSGQTEIELEDGARLVDLQRLLLERHPRLEALWPRLAVAVDGALVKGDAELRDGVEVALLPPVSGGAPTTDLAPGTDLEPAVDLRAALLDSPLDVSAIERRVAAPDCGAVLLFVGTVRNHHRGREVLKLTYTAYREMAQTTLERIVDQLEESVADDGERAQKVRVAIVHRLGDVPVGEASVVIAVASPHREAAYETSRTALERLKREVPIWKREHYGDGDVAWREEEPLVP